MLRCQCVAGWVAVCILACLPACLYNCLSVCLPVCMESGVLVLIIVPIPSKNSLQSFSLSYMRTRGVPAQVIIALAVRNVRCAGIVGPDIVQTDSHCPAIILTCNHLGNHLWQGLTVQVCEEYLRAKLESFGYVTSDTKSMPISLPHSFSDFNE
jgi:hypothetical protein